MKTTLPPQSEYVAEQLAAITEVIRRFVKDDLAMVILFGSFARGDAVQDRFEEDNVIYTYESDFDLLVVTESRNHATTPGESRLAGAIRRRLKREALDQPSSTIIVEDIEHLNKDLERGQYFYSDIQKEGVLLFDSGRHTLSEPKPIDPADRQRYARDDYEHWYTSASDFFEHFEFAFAKQRYSIAAFQLHQATERSLHAIILTFTGYKPKLHDLEKLDRQACNLHSEFFKVFPRATAEQKRLFELLRAAYIDARYKRDFKITQEELDYLAARVRMLQELTKRICEEKIAGMA